MKGAAKTLTGAGAILSKGRITPKSLNRIKPYAKSGISSLSTIIGAMPVMIHQKMMEAFDNLNEDFTARDAVDYAVKATIAEASIEAINPDFKFVKLFKGKTKGLKPNQWVKELKDSWPRLIYSALKETAKENVEEFLQTSVSGAINHQYNNRFKTDFYIPEYKDFKETFILTSIATPLMRGLSGRMKKGSIDKTSTLRVASENWDIMEREIDRQEEIGEITAKEAEQIRNDVKNYTAISGDVQKLFEDENGEMNITNDEFDEFVRLTSQRNKLQSDMKNVSPELQKDYKRQIKELEQQMKNVRNNVISHNNLFEIFNNEREIIKLNRQLKTKGISSKKKKEIQKQIANLKKKNSKLKEGAPEYSLDGKDYKNKKDFLKAVKEHADDRRKGGFKDGKRVNIYVKNDPTAEKDAYKAMGKYAPKNISQKVVMSNAEASRINNFIDGRTKEQIQQLLKEEQDKPDSPSKKTKTQELKDAIKYFELVEKGYVFGSKNFLTEKSTYKSRADKIKMARSLRFMEKYGKMMKGKPEVIQTAAEWKKRGFPNTDAFFDPKTKRFYVNKEWAETVGAVNVGQHEILHGVIYSTLTGPDGLITPEGMQMLNEFIEI